MRYLYQVSVQSTTTNDAYKVSQYEDGHWGCSCSAWIFQRNYPKPTEKRPHPVMRALHDGVLRDKEWLDARGLQPNGKCKHIMFAEERRHDIRTAVTSGAASFSVSNAEFKVELLNGRAAAFFADLDLGEAPTPPAPKRARRKAA